MGKHERPSEKGILDRACEVADLIRGLEIDGVVGIYPYSGIALTADVFKKNFTEWDETPAEHGTFVTAIYRGQEFCSYILEDNNG
ncbi:MAG: hypothetical protein IIW12_00815 [Oscillospiraceae bacterium]|nr:hypothetical protein [Oscillospiraceae bacterium]